MTEEEKEDLLARIDEALLQLKIIREYLMMEEEEEAYDGQEEYL